MRIPKIDNIDDKLRWDIIEKVVTVVVLIYVAFYIGNFLQKQARVRWSSLNPMDLRLTDQFTTGHSLANLESFGIVQADVSFGLPLAFILVKRIEVASRVVQEDTRRSQIV